MNSIRYTKIPDYIAKDLKCGKLSFDQFGLLVFMMMEADKYTGEIVANSKSLSSPLNLGMKRVSNLLQKLKAKSRIKYEETAKKHQGATNPYPIMLCDYMTNHGEESEKQRRSYSEETAKKHAKNETVSKPAPPMEKIDDGTDISIKDQDHNKGINNFPPTPQKVKRQKITSLLGYPKKEFSNQIPNDILKLVREFGMHVLAEIDRRFFVVGSEDEVELYNFLTQIPAKEIRKYAISAKKAATDDLYQWIKENGNART